MNIRELLNHIDTFAPFELAEEWDNSGLLIGCYGSDVKRVGVCLDAVSEAVIEADNQGCNVLVTHHPLIFRPLKNITDNDEQGRTIIEAVKRNVAIIAAHTNWDKAYGGVNDTLAGLIKLKDTEPLGTFGIIGTLPEKMKINDFAEYVKSSWKVSRLDIYSKNLNDTVSRAALCGGSGSEFWKSAKKMNADIYLTADMKYHEISDAVNEGMTIGLVNHGEMERASIQELARKISESGIETVIIDVEALPKPMII